MSSKKRPNSVFGIAPPRSVQGFPSHHWIWKFKRPVLYALGIETAVSAEIDVFKEKTEQCFWNCTAEIGPRVSIPSLDLEIQTTGSLRARDRDRRQRRN